jgi:outer membrane lipoprotein-sorting protein
MYKLFSASWVFLAFLSVMGFSAENGFAYTAEYKQVLETENDAMPIIYNVWVENDKMRMDTDLNGENRALIINESGIYALMPQKNTYMKIQTAPKWPVGARNPVDFALWLKDKEKESLGTEVINGYTCDVYRYRDEQSGSIVTVWIWQGNDFPVKIVLAGGLIESTATFRDIKLNQPIAPEVFQIPQDATKYDPNSLGAMFDEMAQAEEQARDDNSAQLY